MRRRIRATDSPTGLLCVAVLRLSAAEADGSVFSFGVILVIKHSIITKVSMIHPVEAMNVSTKFHADPSNSC